MTTLSNRFFKSHLDVAHRYWRRIIEPGDIVIDATCGNGHDTLMMAQLTLIDSSGSVFAIDIHPNAIRKTQELIKNHFSDEIQKHIHCFQQCHSKFPEEIHPESVKLIAYNLGYLPGGGDKTQTTKVETTLESLNHALLLIKKGGVISVTCYPGHSEGENEENQILNFASSLNPRKWNCCHHQWMNRPKSPSLLMIEALSS